MKTLTSIKINAISGGWKASSKSKLNSCECYCWSPDTVYPANSSKGNDNDTIVTAIEAAGNGYVRTRLLHKESIGAVKGMSECAAECFDAGKIFGKCS